MILNDPDALAAYIQARQQGLIVFDGRMAEGKTYLMRKMSDRIGCEGVDGDDFLTPINKPFLDALRLDELGARIQQARSPLVLLSTICARAVVARLGIADAMFVYVQRTTRIRLEHTRDTFDDDPEEFDRFDTFGISRRSNLKPESPGGEVETYHREHHPRRKADVAYIWALE